MNNTAIKLSMAVGTLATCLGVFEVEPIHAATFGYEFVVEILPQPGVEQPLEGSKGFGFFTFDDASEPVVDPFGVSYFPVDELRFNFLGNTYTAEDDVGLSQETEIPYPTAGFRDNTFLGLNYAVTSTNSTEPGFFFNAVEPSSASDFFVAGRGAIAQRSEDNLISGKSLSVGPSGDPGLSTGQVTYTAKAVPEPSSVLGLIALSALGIGSAWRRNFTDKSKAKN